MTPDLRGLRTCLDIKEGATGHVYQDTEVVMYCMGEKGYHLHDKQSGARLGVMLSSSMIRFSLIVSAILLALTV